MRDVRVIPDIQRIDVALCDRLLALEQALGDQGSINAIQQGLTHAHVFQDWIVQVQINMLIDQAGLVYDLVVIAIAFLEGQRLINGQAQFPGDHVYVARQQIGGQGGSVFNRPYFNFIKIGRLAPPVRIAL